MRSVKPSPASLSATRQATKSLWEEAYDFLREEDSKLIDAYQKDLIASVGSSQQGKSAGLRFLPFSIGFSCTSNDQISLGKGNTSSLDTIGAEPQAQVQKLLEHKFQEVENARLKIKVKGREIVISEQVRKTIQIILSAKDIIGTAISTEPHAALAWAGVLFILPVSI